MEAGISFIRRIISQMGLAFFILISGCSERVTSPSDTFDTLSVEEILALLETAYTDSSGVLLDDFLEQWAEDFSSVVEDTLSPRHKAAFDIYRVFFQPNYQSLVDGSATDSLCTELKYYIIQNTFKVGFVDSEFMDSLYSSWSQQPYTWRVGSLETDYLDTIFTIVDFRPILPDSLPSPLYYNPAMQNVFAQFLDQENEEIILRLDFLRKRLAIMPKLGSLLRYHITTHPLAQGFYIKPADILFDDNLSRAIVETNNYGSGAIIFLVRSGNGWVIEHYWSTWIS